MSNRNVYIVVTRTNTIPSRVIRIYTGSPYNHVSLTLDGRLEDMVSFGRLHPFTPVPGGFVHEGKNKGFFPPFPRRSMPGLQQKNQRAGMQESFAFAAKNRKSALQIQPSGADYTDRRDSSGTGNAYFCSQFCGKVLNESGIHHFQKPFGLLRPADFCGLDGFTLLYEGPLHAFGNQPAATA